MNKARLEKLIVVLKDAKPEDFIMASYSNACGTPACVLGHYAACRDVQRAFKLDAGGLRRSCGMFIDVEDDAVLEHFGLTFDQATALFDADGCNNAKTPKQAIRYIRKFIDSNGKVAV